MDRQIQEGEDADTKLVTGSTDARLQRKRQVNRLSAQRKRIREKNMMKVLSEKCNELVTSRKVLEMERDKLMSFLTVVKAKVDQDDVIATPATVNIEGSGTASDENKIEYDDPKASDSLDFIAKGLLELANSGPLPSKAEHGGCQLDELRDNTGSPPANGITAWKEASTSSTGAEKATDVPFNTSTKMRGACKTTADDIASFSIDRRPMKKRKGSLPPAEGHPNSPAPELKSGPSSFSATSLSSESEPEVSQVTSHLPPSSGTYLDLAQQAPYQNVHSFDTLSMQGNMLNAANVFDGLSAARGSYFANLSRASDDIRTPMGSGVPSLFGNTTSTGHNPFIQPVTQPTNPFGAVGAPVPFQDTSATASQKSALAMLSGLVNNAVANQQHQASNENQLQLALALLLGQVAQQFIPPLVSSQTGSNTITSQQQTSSPSYTFAAQQGTEGAFKRDETSAGMNVHQPASMSSSPPTSAFSKNITVESMMSSLGSSMTHATGGQYEQRSNTTPPPTTTTNIVSPMPPNSNANNDEQQKQAALQLLSALIMQQATSTLAAGRV